MNLAKKTESFRTRKGVLSTNFGLQKNGKTNNSNDLGSHLVVPKTEDNFPMVTLSSLAVRYRLRDLSRSSTTSLSKVIAKLIF